MFHVDYVFFIIIPCLLLQRGYRHLNVTEDMPDIDIYKLWAQSQSLSGVLTNRWLKIINRCSQTQSFMVTLCGNSLTERKSRYDDIISKNGKVKTNKKERNSDTCYHPWFGLCESSSPCAIEKFSMKMGAANNKWKEEHMTIDVCQCLAYLTNCQCYWMK